MLGFALYSGKRCDGQLSFDGQELGSNPNLMTTIITPISDDSGYLLGVIDGENYGRV